MKYYRAIMLIMLFLVIAVFTSCSFNLDLRNPWSGSREQEITEKVDV